MDHYERDIIGHRKYFFAYVGLAIATPISVYLACHFLGLEAVWISRFGAVMTVFSYFADVKANSMSAVLNPGGMVGITFSETRAKYLPYIRRYHWIARALVVAGAMVWGFGDMALV